MILESKVIAIDFDGTIVEDRFPDIGREKPFAFETLRLLQREGHRLVLWTVRKGKHLDEAVRFCEKNGVEFYAVNMSFPNESWDGQSRKIVVDIFVDDRNVGGFPGWGEIYAKISDRDLPKPRKKRFWLF